MLTVRDVLKMNVLKNAKVVAGMQGLDRIVQSGNIMETPEVVSWMKGGEFLVTAGFAFKDAPALRKNLVYELADKGVAAFGIRPGKYFETIPEDMIAYADRVGLPLIELPADVPYIDILLPISEFVINKQRNVLQKSEMIHNELLEVILTEKGVQGVCQTLSRLIETPVFIVNSSISLLAGAVPPSIEEEAAKSMPAGIVAELKQRHAKLASLAPHRWHRLVTSGEEGSNLVIVPAGANSMTAGFLVIIETPRPLEAPDLIALEDASTIVALELVKERAIFEAEKQVRGELLEDLLSGNYRHEDTVIRRAQYLHFELASCMTIFTLGIDGYEDDIHSGGTQSDGGAQSLKADFFTTVHSAFLDFPGGVLFMDKSHSIAGLVHIEDKHAVQMLQRRLREALEQIKHTTDRKTTVSAGIGRAFEDVAAIKKCYEEARAALKIGRLLRGTSSLTFFEELGAYLLLYEIKDSETARQFFRNMLDKVITYDRQNNAELLKTLVQYFRNDGNIRLTAESLYVHKNSVTYRLKLVEQLTNLKLKNPEDKFNLQFCLKLAAIMDNIT